MRKVGRSSPTVLPLSTPEAKGQASMSTEWQTSESKGECRGFKEQQVKPWDKTEYTSSSCGHLWQAPTKPGCEGRTLACSEVCQVKALHGCLATASKKWTPENNQYSNFLGCSHSFSGNTREIMFTSWTWQERLVTVVEWQSFPCHKENWEREDYLMYLQF